ncbi:hypothetical protein WN48_00554 [Eufriesea mexicana]|uniref:uncharacterized transmembrane protein DDB_G0289901 n=1 Tax=Eufriesea mexicana TaxID=516756 RepID=UPI00083C15F3|nr:PREDICTED: uncharacterized transmembrane protein DDB_G0289901 [Eufriesea mexicana]OAD61235.1 hypothetical protein WN48_00554 [Eufriesea mexicana]
MLCSKVVSVCLLGLLALVNGMAENNQGSSEGLPFIQFTDGGIRFNFAGYHAQAGLGGLLTGSQTGGGLHASAGAPWGAHASAGLGGILGGNNANAGGGLYARAGLGNGRHEAAAGLGGLLDGSGRSGAGARGGLFAGATTGTRGIGVSTGGSTSSSSDSQSGASGGNPGDDGGKPAKGRSNIQIIRKKEKVKQVVSSGPGSTEVPTPADPPANKEIREAQPAQLAPAVEPAPAVPPLLNEANEVTQVDNLPTRVRIIRPGRKRFWAPRKQVILEYEPSSVEKQDVVHSNTQKRQTITYSDPLPASRTTATAKNNGNGFFDDVFNIPVSTLNAVNQLLNNNSG